MRVQTIAFSLTLLTATTAHAQSGILAGPFAEGSGSYTPVPGGTFEESNALDFWRDSSGFSGIARSTVPAMRGDYVGGMGGNPAPGFARNNFWIAPMTAGENYVLSGFFRGEEIGGSIGFDVLFTGGFNQIAYQFMELTSDTVGKWYFGYTTFTAPNAETYLRIVRNGGPFGSSNYFDDIALTRANEFVAPTPVPEPATLLALGFGALALNLRKRKRQA